MFNSQNKSERDNLSCSKYIYIYIYIYIYMTGTALQNSKNIIILKIIELHIIINVHGLKCKVNVIFVIF